MRPVILDLYCGAGGAAQGYYDAGFDVVGVDVKPMPRYPFEFVQADALEYLQTADLSRFSAIHASPPCQAYSRATAWSGDRAKHPDLIDTTRAALLATMLPYVIENVQEARGIMRNPALLCGTMFGLQLQSHRYFETTFVLWPPATCLHRLSDYSRDHGAKQTEAVFRDALECEWMTVMEARQAIPPAYTRYIGAQLMAHIKQECAS